MVKDGAPYNGDPYRIMREVVRRPVTIFLPEIISPGHSKFLVPFSEAISTGSRPEDISIEINGHHKFSFFKIANATTDNADIDPECDWKIFYYQNNTPLRDSPDNTENRCETIVIHLNKTDNGLRKFEMYMNE